MRIRSAFRLSLPLPMLLIASFSAAMPTWAAPDRCVLPSQHAGITFSVEHVGADWACRLHPIITNYTTANKVGPMRTPLPYAMYVYLLDHPTVATTLIDRLDLGLYRAESRGPDRYWGNDGEGTEGLVELVYQDRLNRIYYLEGSHESRLLSHVTGKAVIMLRMKPVQQADGREAMETTMVSYTRLNNRVLSGIVSLLRPLVGGTVTRKLVQGVETINRLSVAMREHPDQVLFEATDPPGLPDGQVAFLKAHLGTLRLATSNPQKTVSP